MTRNKFFGHKYVTESQRAFALTSSSREVRDFMTSRGNNQTEPESGDSSQVTDVKEEGRELSSKKLSPPHAQCGPCLCPGSNKPAVPFGDILDGTG